MIKFNLIKLNLKTKKILVTKLGERKNLNNLGEQIKRDFTYNEK